MDIYCYKHNEIHSIHQREAEKLIYQYQIRIIEAATSLPLPNNELTSTDAVLRNAFCVKEDVKKTIPKWRKHVDQTLGKRRNITRQETQAQHRNNLRERRAAARNAAFVVTKRAPIDQF